MPHVHVTRICDCFHIAYLDGHVGSGQKELNWLPPDIFPWLKMYQKCFYGWDIVWTPAGKLTALPRPRVLTWRPLPGGEGSEG